MMSLPESFKTSLAELGKSLGRDLAIEDGRCNFTVDGTVEVEIDYIEESHTVVAWSAAGYAPEDGFAAGRARALLALNGLTAPNDGFSVSMDPETRIAIVHDHRSAETFGEAGKLATWIDCLAELVKRVRAEFEERFPAPDLPDGDGEDESGEEEE